MTYTSKDKILFLEKMAHAELEKVKNYLKANYNIFFKPYNIKLYEAFNYSESEQFKKDFPLCTEAESTGELFSDFCEEKWGDFNKVFRSFNHCDFDSFFYDTRKRYANGDPSNTYYLYPIKIGEGLSLHSIMINLLSYFDVETNYFLYDGTENNLTLEDWADGFYYSEKQFEEYRNTLYYIIFKFYNQVVKWLEPCTDSYRMLETFKNHQTEVFKEFMELREETLRRQNFLESRAKINILAQTVASLNITPEDIQNFANYMKERAI